MTSYTCSLYGVYLLRASGSQCNHKEIYDRSPVFCCRYLGPLPLALLCERQCPHTPSLSLSFLCIAGICSPTVASRGWRDPLIKKKIKFSSYIRKFRAEQLQSHIWLTASSYMGKYLRISSYNRKPFLIYDFAAALLWISWYMRKILFYFLSVDRPKSDNSKKPGILLPLLCFMLATEEGI